MTSCDSQLGDGIEAPQASPYRMWIDPIDRVKEPHWTRHGLNELLGFRTIRSKSQWDSSQAYSGGPIPLHFGTSATGSVESKLCRHAVILSCPVHGAAPRNVVADWLPTGFSLGLRLPGR
jgi:hypothetical protein